MPALWHRLHAALETGMSRDVAIIGDNRRHLGQYWTVATGSIAEEVRRHLAGNPPASPC
jgi:hypothetical protein